MSLFVLDTAGDQALLSKQSAQLSKTTLTKKRQLLEEKKTSVAPVAQNANESDDNDNSEDDGDYFGLPPPNVDISNIINSTLAKTAAPKTKAIHEMERAEELLDAALQKQYKHAKSRRERVTQIDYSDFNERTGKFDGDDKLIQTNVNKEMDKTALVPGFEQKKLQPKLAHKKEQEMNRVLRAKTKGSGWFNLPATEMTDEIKRDLKLIQMRSVLDPKHFYKKNDLKVLPKYFQIGTVQHSPLDYYSERHTRKNKQKSIVEELLGDQKALDYTKRRYKTNAMLKDRYARRKAIKKMKKLKKKNK